MGRLRSVRKRAPLGELVVISAVDPLNLVGILTPEARVAAVYRNRILALDGVPIAAVEGGQVRRLAASDFSDDQLRTLLARRSLRQPMQPHFKAGRSRTPSGRTGVRSSIYHH